MRPLGQLQLSPTSDLQVSFLKSYSAAIDVQNGVNLRRRPCSLKDTPPDDDELLDT